MNLTANRCDLYSVTSSKIFPVSEGRRSFRNRYDMTSVARNVKSRIFLDAFIILYVSYKLKYLQRNHGRNSAEGGGGVGGRGCNQQNFFP